VPTCLLRTRAYGFCVSTTALHIIELVKSLPLEDQQAVRAALLQEAPLSDHPPRSLFLRDADGKPYDPDGIPNDDPIFRLLEEIEEERHRDPGPPAPQFD
jgi:hypothetical protein